MSSVLQSKKKVMQKAKAICEAMLSDLEKAQRPVLTAVKCSLDNSIYNAKVGYFTPGDKMVRSELNVSSVQKLSRTIFVLDILLNNLEIDAVNTKREIYYMTKGLTINGEHKSLDFEEQSECDSIIDYIMDLLEIYREEFNCFAGDRGGQTYSQQLVVTEFLNDGEKAVVDLSTLGTMPYQPKNKPQALKLKVKKKVDFCLVVESEGTANTLVTMGFTKRHNCILMGAMGVPTNGVRGWCKLIQDQLKVPIYFYGDLDAYTLQNIYRTLKAGSAASLIRNKDFSAPEVRFLGLLPEDIKKYNLPYRVVKENNPKEARALKKAKDALKNDPFFQDKKNKKLTQILHFLIKNKIRCEQQALMSVDPKDPLKPEKIIIEKIKSGSWV